MPTQPKFGGGIENASATHSSTTYLLYRQRVRRNGGISPMFVELVLIRVLSYGFAAQMVLLLVWIFLLPVACSLWPMACSVFWFSVLV